MKRKNFMEPMNEHYESESHVIQLLNESSSKKPTYPAQEIPLQAQSQRLETFKKLKAKYGVTLEKGN